MMLAQTYPTDMTHWTPAAVIAVMSFVVVFFIPALVLLIKAMSDAKSALVSGAKAEGRAEANSRQIATQQTALISHDAQLTELALHTAAPLKSTPATDLAGHPPMPTPELTNKAFNMADGKDVT
jgi:hypothetical protein